MKEHKWCAIDAEGDVGNKGLLGVAFYDAEGGKYLTDHTDIALELFMAAEAGCTFLAHNAQYDLSVIFWQLKIPMKAVYYNGRFNHGEWKYHPNRKLCHLWDTLALSGGLSLAKLGKAIGYPKYDTPQRLLGKDPDKYNWKCATHNVWECEECYAVRDAEIVYRFMTDLTSTLAGWGIQPHHRISGLAVKVWQVMDNPQPIQLKDWKMDTLARKAYHGGRVETFKLGTLSPLYTADVCSMYPSVMQNTPYPDPSTMVYLDNPAVGSVNWNYEGVAEIAITIPLMYVPPLPYAHKGLLKYPVGRWKGAYTFREIRYAIGLGCTINQVYQAAFSTANLYPFTNFVTNLWAMRQEYEKTKDPRTLFAKLLMNNLYGRLGMGKKMERRDIYLAEPGKPLKEQPKTEWYTEDSELFLTYERELPHGNQWTNVLWAAQTTAEARIRLHHFLLLQGDGLVYCDTDSVFSTRPIVGMGDGLGSLRDEQTYQQAVIAAPKLYAIQRYDRDMPDTWKYEPCKPHHKVTCTECKWIARAKGIPQSLAYQFLRQGLVTYSQPIKPFGQNMRHIKAGTWVEITKENHRVPARRHPVDVQSLFHEYGWSDTAADVIGPLPL